MIHSENILKGFRVTEKAANLQVGNKYTFVVSESANAVAIGKAVENTMNVKGKVKVSNMSRNNPGVKGKMKKAVVTLKKCDAIQIA